MALKRIGVDKVWVLEGGLKAWREHGFPSLNPRKCRKSLRSAWSQVARMIRLANRTEARSDKRNVT